MSFDRHSTALIEPGNRIGSGCSIRAYAVLRGGAAIGGNCSIGEHTVLEGRIDIAANVEIGANSFLRGPMTIGQGVHVGPGACLDARSGEPIIVKEQAAIGARTVLAPGVLVGERAIIEAGSVVVRNVPANAVVAGNPAKIVRYIATRNAPPIFQDTAEGSPVLATMVRGVTLHHLPLVEDLRGNLSFGEVARHVPFPIQRYFLTFDVAGEEVRGEHAHRALHQFLVCVHGRLHILADDGHKREEFILDRPNLALHLPPLVWGVQYRFSPNAVLLVLCSDIYDPADYIRDYEEFLALTAAAG